MKRICMRIVNNAESINYGVKMLNLLQKEGYYVSCICNGKIVVNSLLPYCKELYDIEKYDNMTLSKEEENSLLNYLIDNDYYNFRDFYFTNEYVYPFYKNISKELEKLIFKRIKTAKEIIESGINSDYYIDFAGNDINHTIFDFIAKCTKGKKIGYRESLFPDRAGFSCNKLGIWIFPPVKNDFNYNNEEIEYVDNFISEYFDSKKVFWGEPKTKDYQIDFSLKRYFNKKNFKEYFKYDTYAWFLNSVKRYIRKYYVNIYYDTYETLKGKKYFYFPLHYPFDSNLIYRGKPFIEQISFIKQLSHYIPYNYYLVVKEHPHARGAIEVNEIKQLRKIKNLILLHPFINSHNIILNATSVIVINSSVALESLYHLTPVVSFGRNYLTGHNLVNEIKGFYEFEKVFDYKNYIFPSIDKFKNFLIQAYKYSEPFNFYKLLTGNFDNELLMVFKDSLLNYLNHKLPEIDKYSILLN